MNFCLTLIRAAAVGLHGSEFVTVLRQIMALLQNLALSHPPFDNDHCHL